jgi:hypothetical protein
VGNIAEVFKGWHSYEALLQERQALGRKNFLVNYACPVLLIRVEGGLHVDPAKLSTGSMDTRSPARHAKEIWAVPVLKRVDDAFPNFIWVGRESRNDIVLPFYSVSKLQAQFVQRGQAGLELLDVGSTNGTTVDGVRLEANKLHPVQDGASVCFGALEARYRTAQGLCEELGLFSGAGRGRRDKE